MTASSFFLLVFLQLTGGGPVEARSYPTTSLEDCTKIGTELMALLKDNLTVTDFAMQCVEVSLATFRKDRS